MSFYKSRWKENNIRRFDIFYGINKRGLCSTIFMTDEHVSQHFQMRITWPVVLPATPLMSLLSDCMSITFNKNILRFQQGFVVERIRISYFLTLSRVAMFYATTEQKLIHSFKEYLKLLNRLYDITWFPDPLGQFTLNKPRSDLWKA